MFGKRKISAFDDTSLLEKYRESGDLVYIGELYKKYARQVLSVCLFYFKDKDDAKDHVMQIFDKLIKELKEKHVDNFKGWLSFVVRNYCITVLRKQKTEKKHLEGYAEYEFTILSESTELELEQIKDSEISRELIKQGLQQLKPEQSECLRMFYLENRSYNEISQIKNFSLNEVKSYIQNGKRNLKLFLLEKQKELNPHVS